MDVGDALRLYGSKPAGLEKAEADRRREEFGPNRLPAEPPRSPWAVAFAQLRGFLNLVLMCAAVLAGVIGDVKDAVLIGAIVIFNTALGFLQEHRAERTLAALKAMVALRARVLRGERAQEVPADQLVPGDVVLLEGGDRVPADGRVIEAHTLEVDESALTGESVPVTKRAQALVAAASPIAERANFAFMNTVVTRGRGVLLVTATGKNTQMGQVARMLDETIQPRTPLQRQLDQLGRRLAAIAVVVVTIISAFELLRGDRLANIAFEAIALFVAAIPEGLPAVVTVTLALGLHRMARHRAIVKRLAAVETLGCTTVICTDKTGTLTMNQMTARALWCRAARFSVSGEGYRAEGTIESSEAPAGGVAPDLAPLAVAMALCNDSRLHEGKLVGDPTEGALLVLSQKAGLDVEATRARLPRVAEVPFESGRMFMATFHTEGEAMRVFVKGAPDVVLGRCDTLLGSRGAEPLDDGLRRAVVDENERMASRGLRVLAVASHSIPAASSSPGSDPIPHVSGLTLIGLVGLMDPPRPEARQAIEQCKAAGITVKMITGDHRGTAGAIASELGLRGEVVDGAELDHMSDERLAARIEKIAVFARVAPEHKLRIVGALKARGHVVAMTGDGVNDAPALKSADIGVAMGSGTEVAKEAATMVLTDDNFATIVGAVREGRTIYDNILKFVRFQLSTNMGAILTVFFAPLLGLPTPLKPIHILFVAMFADGPPAIALGLDPSRSAIMQESPRPPGERMLTGRRLGVLVFHGAIMAAGTLGLLRIGGRDADHAATLAFTTFVLFQLFNLLNVRSEGRSAFNRQLFTNHRLWVAVALVVAMQIGIVNWSALRGLFATVPLSLEEWGLAVAFASTLVVLDEARKLGVRALSRLKPRGARLGRPGRPHAGAQA
jgi:Ca2+-transporting ATPase